MNNFTIEELVLIGMWSINRYEQVGIQQAKEEGTINLSHKIQDMIVNYCEHEKVVPNYGPNTQCDKCGEIW